MSDFIIKLLLAHVLGDFVFQKQSWAVDKSQKHFKSKYIYLHTIIHGLVLFLLFQGNPLYWHVFLATMLSHYVIDGLKSYFIKNGKDGLLLFVIDQILHLLVMIILLYYYFPDTEKIVHLVLALNRTDILLMILFVILVTFVMSIVLKQVLSVFKLQPQQSLYKSAGVYIGIFERLLIFICIVSGFIEGIGYLLAAKSIFRFGDLTKAGHRSMTEYVLIGTLLSFTSAILLSLLYLAVRNVLT